MILKNILIVDPINGEYTGEVIVNNNIIEKIIKKDIEYEYILMPGFVDTHTHGYGGIDTMYMTKEDLKNWAELNFFHGITRFYPTTVSASKTILKRIINNFQPVLSAKSLHLEGPYINKIKKGAQNEEFIYSPNINDLKEIINEKIKIITMAPEISGFFNVVSYLKEHKVVVSLGHSNGDYYIFKNAFENEIDRITHFPNALKGLHHREIGGVGAGLLEPFKVELIVDKIHSSPEFIKLIYKIKDIKNIILITDSISATNLNDGKYELGGLEVFVNNGKATLKDGTIAGSTLTFDVGVKNFHTITNCSFKELALVSSFNALNDLGIKGEGRIKEGYIANFVLLDKDLNIKSTFFEGICVYDNEHL